jgi:hypothetical protein
MPRYGWALHVIDDAGHAAHIEQPGALLDRLVAPRVVERLARQTVDNSSGALPSCQRGHARRRPLTNSEENAMSTQEQDRTRAVWDEIAAGYDRTKRLRRCGWETRISAGSSCAQGCGSST